MKVGNQEVADPETIYALCIGIQLSDPEFNFLEVLDFELSYYPPALFDKDGNMRLATNNSTLEHILGVTINQKTFGIPTHIIDASAYLWALEWPKKGNFSLVIEEVKKCIKKSYWQKVMFTGSTTNIGTTHLKVPVEWVEIATWQVDHMNLG